MSDNIEENDYEYWKKIHFPYAGSEIEKELWKAYQNAYHNGHNEGYIEGFSEFYDIKESTSSIPLDLLIAFSVTIITIIIILII